MSTATPEKRQSTNNEGGVADEGLESSVPTLEKIAEYQHETSDIVQEQLSMMDGTPYERYDERDPRKRAWKSFYEQVGEDRGNQVYKRVYDYGEIFPEEMDTNDGSVIIVDVTKEEIEEYIEKNLQKCPYLENSLDEKRWHQENPYGTLYKNAMTDVGKYFSYYIF